MQKEKRKCLTWNQRLKIEALYNAGHTPKEIAEQMCVHFTTIYRELKKGKTIKRNSDLTEVEIYSPDLAQSKYEEQLKRKGRDLKIGNDHKFVKYVENKIVNENKSPAAVLADIEREDITFDTEICLSTFYNYIRNGVFLNITLKDCPYRCDKKKRKKKKVQKRVNKGTSIEERPEEINSRITFGHWEMDTVIGKSTDKKCLLVLTERLTREEIVELLQSHTAAEVVKALDRIERRFTEKGFRENFKSITVDNGCEFADVDGIERSRRNKKKRTKVYYCNPYSSYERGSNENQNRMLRRFFPKGETMSEVTKAQVKKAEEWINNYPRKIHNYRSAEDLFQEHCWKATA